MLNDKEVSQIYNNCNVSKQTWNSTYYEVFSYTQPERNYIWRGKSGNSGNLKQISLYTQAGKIGSDVFVARVQNKLTPFQKPYINFVPKKSLESKSIKELRNFCSLMSKRCNERKEELKLDMELADAYYDLIPGTACIMKENTANGINFKKIPFTDYKLDTNQHQSVCRSFSIPYYKVGILYPELLNKDFAGLNLNGIDKFKDIQLTDILFYNERNRVWEYYLRYNDKILLTRIYKKSPYHIFHWTRSCDMPYGAGVGLKALPALKRLNSYIKINLELLPFVFPMFLTNSGNFLDKNIEFKPGGIINVQNLQATKPIQMLSGQVAGFSFEIQKEELDIKSTFLDYTLPTDPRQMTAAEVYARSNPQDEMVQMNVAKLTNIIKDIAWDIFDDIYTRELTLEIPLEQLHSMIDCEINNDSFVDNNLIQKISGYIQNVGMFDPNAIWQSLNKAKTIELLGQAYNLPVDMRFTAEEIDENIQASNQQEQEIMQAGVEAQMLLDQNKENARLTREQALKE